MRRLLITDLDNTLYDWVTFFARSFRAMTVELSQSTGIPEEVLLDEFRAVHQRHGNSEYPFAVLELPSLRAIHPGRSDYELLEAVNSSLHAFNRTRKNTLRLYDGVATTLSDLRSRGVTVVGHTEAIAVNACDRLRRLQILPHFSAVFALESRLPPHPVAGRLPFSPPTDVRLHQVPVAERKPNPALLLDICAQHDCAPADSVYVGDSIVRDISMAAGAGVVSAWAEYGTRYDRSDWETLVRVTHWTPDDVARESTLREEFSRVRPDVVLQRFSDVLELF